MNSPTVEPKLVNPLIQALARQREILANAAAELEARNFVLATENFALKQEIEALTSGPTSLNDAPVAG